MATKEKTLSLKAFLDVNGFSKPLAEMKKGLDDAGRDFKVAASEAKAFGSKTDELNVKQKHLRDTIEKQDKVVKTLREAYEKSKKETGENSSATNKLADEVAKAKIKYNNLNSELHDTSKALEDTTDKQAGARKGLADWVKTGLLAGGTAGFVGKALGLVQSGLGVIGDIAGGAFDAIKSGASIALGAVESLSKAIGKIVLDSGKAADEAMTMAAKMGLSAQQVQELQYASELVDVDLETMAGSLSKLTVGVGKAAKEQKDYNAKLADAIKHHKKAKPALGDTAAAFKELKVKITDSKGAYRDMNDVWADTITALGKVKNETKRDLLAQKLYGKSFAELKPLVAAGGDALKKLAKEARASGYVMSDAQLTALGNMDDSYQRFLKTADGVRNFIGAALSPAFTTFFDTIVKNAPALEKEMTPAMNDLGNALGDAASELAPLLPDLASAGASLIPDIASAIKEALPFVKQLLKDAPGAIEKVKDAFKGMPKDTIKLMGEFAVNSFQVLAKAAVDSAPAIGSIIGTIADNKESIITAVTTLAKSAPKFVDSFAKFVNEVAPPLLEVAPKVADAFAAVATPISTVLGLIARLNEMAVSPWLDLIGGGTDKKPKGTPSVGPYGPELRANGGVTHGGVTWVGERGPEPVILPRGSRVVSNSEARQLLGGGSSKTVHHTGTIRHELVGADGIIQLIKDQIVDDLFVEVRMA